MILHDDKTVTLDEDESQFIGLMLQGALKGYYGKVDEGHYFTKEEKEVTDLIKDFVRQLEDGDII